jgi:hypothetical protein
MPWQPGVDMVETGNNRFQNDIKKITNDYKINAIDVISDHETAALADSSIQLDWISFLSNNRARANIPLENIPQWNIFTFRFSGTP